MGFLMNDQRCKSQSSPIDANDDKRALRRPSRPCPTALAVAMTAGLAAVAEPATAQLVTSSGDVSPSFAQAASVDLSGQRVFLGFTNGSVGTQGILSVTGGGSLTAAQLVPGTGGLGIGIVSVSGPTSVVNLTGGASFNGLDIGSWGNGTMTVSNGATVACSSPLACAFSSIGNGAGSTGLLTVNGGVLSGFGSFAVGSGNLSTGFGTPGAATTATLNLLNDGTRGGSLATTGYSSVASNSGQAGLVTGNVAINGADSNWTITRDLANDGGQAFLGIAPAANTNANITISNGGSLNVIGSRSTPVTDNSLPGLNMSAAPDSTSTMTVTTGGSVRIGGDTGVITLGGNSSTASAGATATLNITGGGSVSGTGLNGLTFMAIGQNLGEGTINVSGVGSQLTVAGVGGQNTQGLDGVGGLIVVGRNRNNGGGGTGNLNVTNGGSVTISDNGQVASTASMGLRLAEGAGSRGTASVDAASIIVSSTGGTATTPYIVIGQGGIGEMTVSNGGQALIQGSGQRNFIVGNASAGSATLNVNSGAEIGASWFAVGNNGATGAAIINNATVNLDGVVYFNDPVLGNVSLGAGLRVARGAGAIGSLALENGAIVNINNSIADSSVILGGTGALTGGTGTLEMSGASQINFTGSAASASLQVGGSNGGTGIMSMAGGSSVNVGATGGVTVAGVSGSTGSLTLSGGSKATANSVNIGGNSDAAGFTGGAGTAVVSGLGSELNASGAAGFIGVGRGGTGTLTVTDQGKVSAIGVAVGRNGGLGTLNAQNATLEFTGQQTTVNPSGAFLSIGTGGSPPNGADRGGTGIVTFVDSTVTITNLGSLGASVNVGGSGNYPGGTGVLGLTNSQLTVNAAAGAGNISIGRSGIGVATLSTSTITNTDGNVFVGREVGSSGTLMLNNGSVLNAAYVGAGTLQPYDGTAYNGGVGTIVLNDSTINAGRFELGANGILTGNNGTLNVVGDVVIGGTISPGQSPGRIRIRCNVIMLPGSRIVLEISGSGSNPADYEFDQLIIGEDATFDLASAEIVFSFLGETNPNVVSNFGGLNLDFYLRAGSEDPLAPVDAPTQALSTQFAPGQTWSSVVDSTRVSAVSESYNVTEFKMTGDGTFAIEAVPVPEPSTWGLMFVGLAAVGGWARRRKAQAAQA
jgi:T5SS/PEP-CTERM-associated repeat protein